MELNKEIKIRKGDQENYYSSWKREDHDALVKKVVVTYVMTHVSYKRVLPL